MQCSYIIRINIAAGTIRMCALFPTPWLGGAGLAGSARSIGWQ